MLLGGCVPLLYLVFMTGFRPAMEVCLGVVATVSLFAWYLSFTSLRGITSEPTSRIASASQGYAKLRGTGRPYSKTPVISKLTGFPCLWYRYRVEQKNDQNKWVVVDSGESSEPFLLDDGSGACLVDPRGADVETTHQDSWYAGAGRCTEWTLLASDAVSAFGDFCTTSGGRVERTINDEVKMVIGEWKRDMPALQRRFDLDGDGQLDEKEWELVRRAAGREAESRLDAARAEPERHFLIKPQGGRLFLITNLDQDALARRYLLLSRIHVAVVFACLAGIAWAAG
ncbi:MAG TPA: hypothetical protein VF801_10700 [Rhodocyclaceae bacterium]